MTAEILNYGGIIRKLVYKSVDVVRGRDSVEEYLNNSGYFGALIYYGEKHYKKHVENFTVKHNLERCGGFAYICGKQSDDNFEFIENDTEYYLNFNPDKATNRKANKDKIRYFNFDMLCEKCKLYDDFLNDKRWLYHEELFGLASNLNNIEGGKKRFLEIIEESSFESYRQKDWRYCFTYMTAQEYKPQKCEKFCPYADECNHAANIVLTGKADRNTVVKLKEKEYCTLDEAVAELQENLEKAINSSRNQINIIKAQTAIGKTHCYVELIKNTDKRFIVAVPTNILKEEVYNRLKFAGVEGVVKTASISTLEQRTDEIGEKVREFNSLGAYNDLVDYLKKEAKDDKEYLLDYIKPLEQYGTDDVRVIVTTHKKFLNAKEDFLRQFESIIDEDILLSSVKNSVSVLKEDILKLKKYPKVQEVLKEIKSGKDRYTLTEPCDDYISYKTIRKKNISSKMKFMEVEDDCYKYWLHTYEEPNLRKIQLWLLKSELIQAVGRARLLRYDCTVKLYASIPLNQAEVK